jgi:hypothetical protein
MFRASFVTEEPEILGTDSGERYLSTPLFEYAKE